MSDEHTKAGQETVCLEEARDLSSIEEEMRQIIDEYLSLRTWRSRKRLIELVAAMSRMPKVMTDENSRFFAELLREYSTTIGDYAKATKQAYKELDIEWDLHLPPSVPEVHNVWSEEPEFLSNEEIASICELYLSGKELMIPSQYFVRVLMRRFIKMNSRKKSNSDLSQDINWLMDVWALSKGDARRKVASLNGKSEETMASDDRRERRKRKIPTGGQNQ